MIPTQCCCDGGEGGACNCFIQAGDNATVTGSGTEGDPFIVSADDPPASPTFAASSTDGSIIITPGGPDGHEPNLEVNPAILGGGGVDPAGDTMTGTLAFVLDPFAGALDIRNNTDTAARLGITAEGLVVLQNTDGLDSVSFQLYETIANTLQVNGSLRTEGPLTTIGNIVSSLVADTQDRIRISPSDTSIYFGSGSAIPDIRLFRSGTNVLSLASGDSFRVAQDPSDNNDVTRRSYVDDKKRRGVQQIVAAGGVVAINQFATTVIATHVDVPLTLQLPTGATTRAERQIAVTLRSPSQPVTIDPGGLRTINGAATLTLNTQYQSAMLEYVESLNEWSIVASHLL